MQRSIEVAIVLAAVAGFAAHGSASERIVFESARRIPVVAEADVVIVGRSWTTTANRRTNRLCSFIFSLLAITPG